MQREPLPWEPFDSYYFGKFGIAPFKRHSAEYDDFLVFFKRYRLAKPQTLTKEYLRQGLELFQQFQQKKLKAMSEKITKDRQELPVYKFKEQIIQSVCDNRVVLIAADTGAGKSTQIPQYLMEAGFDKIACTQPRRIACYSLAKRVSFESLNQYGSEVAYQVRFDGSKTEKTRVLFLTEGVLMRQYAGDPYLKMYNIIIIDEVHERHITSDFLLAILKRLLTERLDLKLVLMSATINAELFSNYFSAPIIQIPGRMFPVSIEYYPVADEDTNLTDQQFIEERKKAEIQLAIPSRGGKIKAGPYLKIIQRIDETIPSHERGDLLIFVSGMFEIGVLAEELKAYANFTRKWIVLELHSSLSVAQQEKVFDYAPEGVRKCIISTNIAETSVTIDGIRFLIDSGRVKEMGFDNTVGISRLSEYWISKSSAKQRAGRAGRTGPGLCFRFYTKKEYEAFNDFPTPEILRMPLTSIILDIKALGLGDPRCFEFIERPSEININSSVINLQTLGCLNSFEEITALGRALSTMPVNQVLGKMLLLGSISQLLAPIVTIAAVLSIQSPYLRENSSKVLEKRRELLSNHGDPFTLINTFTSWLDQKSKEGNASRKWCKLYGIEEQRMYEIVSLKSQFEKILRNYTLSDSNTIETLEYEQNLSEDEAFAKREQKRLLEKKKRENRSNKRKFLKFVDESDISSEEGEETVKELEFKISHNAEDLLMQTDVSMLSKKDLILIKIIVCSGLYPNVAIPDAANYARPTSEQVFHTKSKRFLSMVPNSVFALNPELLHGEVERLADEEPVSLENLHSKRVNRDLLCFVDLLETTKPFLINTLVIGGLPISLLFAQRLDISADLLHFVIDEWLDIEFSNRDEALKALNYASWLRYSWEKAVNIKLHMISRDLEENTAKKQSVSNPLPLKHLDYIPKAIALLRDQWFDIEFNSHTEISDDDVIDGLIDLVDVDIAYNCQKLKMSNIDKIFGYNPFEDRAKNLTVKVTPHINYYIIPSSFDHNHKRFFKLPSVDTQAKSVNSKNTTNLDSNQASTVNRTLFECPTCFKNLLLTSAESQRHLERCAL